MVENPDPVTVAWLMTRLELPVFVRVTLCEELWPTTTLPKLSDAGEMDRPGCVPVPVSEMESGELEASLVIVRVLLLAPADVGEY